MRLNYIFLLFLIPFIGLNTMASAGSMSHLKYDLSSLNEIEINKSILQNLDYLTYVLDSTERKKSWYNSKAARISYAPAALFLATALVWDYKEDVRELRNRFIPNFSDHSDDVTQFVPALLVYGLNIYGIKGKHSIKRATSSLVTGAGITALVVTTMKYTTEVLRPDGSTYNSFPSGHTATAFVTATFLHKEYGHRSPLYSILGYGLAAYTGVFRQLNNRHWISDVTMGAGLGILGTELGYLIMDEVYKEKEINPEPTMTAKDRPKGKPHYVSVKLGYANALSEIKREDLVIAEHGFNAGIDGAYFFTNVLGLAAEFSVTSLIMDSKRFNELDEVEQNTHIDKIETEAIGLSYALFGPSFHIQMNEKWFTRVNAMGGYAKGADGLIYAKLTDAGQEVVGDSELPLFEYSPDESFTFKTGFSVERKIGRNTSIGAYFDYYYARPDVTYSAFDFQQDVSQYTLQEVETVKENMDTYAIGVSFSAMLW